MQIRRYERVKKHVVFVHGAGGGAWEWAIWRRMFAAHGWTVVARDLLPAGGELAQTRLQDYADQVESWMHGEETGRARNHLPRTALVGASLGGLLALIAARRVAPAALVLVNPVPPAGVEPGAAGKDYPDVVPWGSARSFSSTRRAMPDADDAACRFAFRRWRDESGAVLREAARGVSVGALAAPSLVFASECDTDVAPAASRAFADRYGAEFRLLRGASHLAPLLGRCAGAVAERAVDWCADMLR